MRVDWLSLDMLTETGLRMIKARKVRLKCQCVRVPFVGRDRIKGFRSVGEEVFVDSSGMGAQGETALTMSQFIDHMLSETKKHGLLWWGITSAGQFQVYVKAWKYKGA